MVIDTLFVIDVCMVVLLMVMANLSQRIGDALRIPKYYTVFYGSVAIIVSVGFLDQLPVDVEYLNVITAMIRIVAVVISIPVAVRYWHWLLKEKLEN